MGSSVSDNEYLAVAKSLGQLRHLFQIGVGSLTPHDAGLVRSAIRSLESVTSGRRPAFATPRHAAVLTLLSTDGFQAILDGSVLIWAADGYLADERCYHNWPTGFWCDLCGGDNTVPRADPA